MSSEHEPVLTYEWPTLAEEGREMIASSVLMYGLSHLRTLARQGLLTKGEPEKNERVLKLPLSADELLEVAEANKDTLSSHYDDHQKETYGAALQNIKKSIAGGDDEDMQRDTFSQELLIFDDENSMQELVYGIEVNHARKRICVGFRGSVTTRDFMVDGKAYITEYQNPLAPDDPSNTIGIHHGFHDYLFGSSSRAGKSSETNDCKANVIKEQVAALFEKYPDYRLYCTGHSLGGALAVLLGADVASSNDPRIPLPVSVIAIAAPKTGNRAFLKAFKTLENQGLIRCLRINNYKDAITFLPDRGRNLTTCSFCERRIYKHVGFQLVIDKSGNHQFHYPKDEGGFLSRMTKNWTWYCGHDIGMLMAMPLMAWYYTHFYLFHSCTEYIRRFELFAARNEDLYLNDLYKQDVKDLDSDFEIY